MKKLILIILLIGVVGCSAPKPVPGLSHLSKARVYSDDSIEIKPGETKTIEFTLETRKDGPGIFKIGGISHVSGEYSDAVILPMPEGLGVNLEPKSFMAYPDSTYKSVLTITTSPELAPGEYWLRFDQEFERSFRGYGLIRVTVKQ